MMNKGQEVVTVGHSTHAFMEFVELLGQARVTAVVDVRRLPGSSKYPHFNEDPLKTGLSEQGVAYRRISALGGRRNVDRDVPDNVNGFWQNRSFHNYADYALSDDFNTGLSELISLSAHHRVAVMCAEAVWWRCHRRIIADHLIARGLGVVHLMPNGKTTQAAMTAGAVIEDDTVKYPR